MSDKYRVYISVEVVRENLVRGGDITVRAGGSIFESENRGEAERQFREIVKRNPELREALADYGPGSHD